MCVLAFNWCGQHFPCRDKLRTHEVLCGKFLMAKTGQPNFFCLIIISRGFFFFPPFTCCWLVALLALIGANEGVPTPSGKRALRLPFFFPFVVVAVPKTTWKVYEMLLSFVGKMCHRRPFFGAVKYKTFVLISCGQRTNTTNVGETKTNWGRSLRESTVLLFGLFFFFLSFLCLRGWNVFCCLFGSVGADC